MENIKNEKELKQRIELCVDELNYFINETFCKRTMRMMSEYMDQTNCQLERQNSEIAKLQEELKAYKDAEEQGLLLKAQDLEEHDKEIRNKALDEFAKKLDDESTFLKRIESDSYGMLHFEDVYKIAAQMKEGTK